MTPSRSVSASATASLVTPPTNPTPLHHRDLA